jgi:type III restriction enzyme
MSQLLCEQVVGRGLRRTNYKDFDEKGRLREEVAKILGVPFEVIPFKANSVASTTTQKRYHVHAVAAKGQYRIEFPRVTGYRQAIRNRVTVNWAAVAPLPLNPLDIPVEIRMKAGIPNNQGRPSIYGPGKLEDVDLVAFRSGRRLQSLLFDLAADLTRDYVAQAGGEALAQVLFPQVLKIVEKYLHEKVEVIPPNELLDAFLAPYYGWIIERLVEAIQPDVSEGEASELPVYETNRGPGSTAEVDFWTSRNVCDVVKSHLNYVVADTQFWEQSAAHIIDNHPAVDAFVKNACLGFAIPYLHDGQMHDYIPDFIIRFKGKTPRHLILEVKGYDERAEIKAQAAQRWVNAVNADGHFGAWHYAMARRPEEVDEKIKSVIQLSSRR